MTIWIIDIDNATNEQKMLFCIGILSKISFEQITEIINSIELLIELVKNKNNTGSVVEF